jgi:hypothetical protein
MDASPRTTIQYIKEKLTSGPGAPSDSSNAEGDNEISLRVRKLRDVTRLLEWLHSLRDLDERTLRALAYLQGCVEIQSLRVDNAMNTLKALGELEQSLQFPHYRISIRDMSILRLAQAYDLLGERQLATEEYLRLKKEYVIPELQDHAERGLTMPFKLPTLGHKLLLRQYSSELADYRDVLLFTKELSS